MLRSYLLALIAGLQAVAGINFSTQIFAQQLESSPQVDEQIAYESRPVAQTTDVSKVALVDSKQVDYVQDLKSLNITLHPGSDFAKDSVENPISLQHCASLVYKTLQLVPQDVSTKVKDLTLYFNSTGRRGLGGGSTIILRCQNVTDAELVSVFVHELGHIKDTGVLQGNFWAGESEFRDGQNSIYNDDKSLDFYRLSFVNEKEIKKDASDLDFVSGYAMSDPFEDFAETFNYYLLHGDDFRQLAANNDVLAKKYNFMKENVFAGKEFDFQSEKDDGLLTTRHYDSTLISYNLDKFLAI